MFKIFLFTCIICITQFIYAQEPDPASFFPSAVGNIWQYDTQFSFYQIEILRDSIDDDGNRFLFRYFLDKPDIMLDTNFNVFWIHSAIDTILYHYYKLDAQQGDTWLVYQENPNSPGAMPRRDARIDTVYLILLFNEVRTAKEIGYYDGNFGDTVLNEYGYLGKEIIISGIGEYMSWDVHSGPTQVLRGCIIDGDTLGILTSVKDELLTAQNFVLYQNYPNPFNPVTNIEYKIEEASDIILIVYNILGEKIKILDSGYRQIGRYKLTLDASDLPSGMYIYILKAGKYSSSKKMIVIK